jgi:uncharacterized membrane protein
VTEADRDDPPATRRYRTNRLEAFSDGVLAIAITLLVLELSVPEVADGGSLLEALLAQWPEYLAYLVSFATIGAIWVAHSAVTEYLDEADPTILRLNLLLLFFVSLLPFTTRLLAEYFQIEAAERVAVTIYGLNLLLGSVVLSAMWQWARHAGLVSGVSRDEEVRYLTRRLAPGVGGYVAILLVGIFQPTIAVLGYLLVALFFMIPLGAIRESRSARSTLPPS